MFMSSSTSVRFWPCGVNLANMLSWLSSSEFAVTYHCLDVIVVTAPLDALSVGFDVVNDTLELSERLTLVSDYSHRAPS